MNSPRFSRSPKETPRINSMAFMAKRGSVPVIAEQSRNQNSSSR